jgi:hypothetical protein
MERGREDIPASLSPSSSSLSCCSIEATLSPGLPRMMDAVD